MDQSAPHQACEPYTVTKREFAKRLKISTRTLERARDHLGRQFTAHSRLIDGRSKWQESYVLECAEAHFWANRRSLDVDPLDVRHTPEEAGRLLGLDYRMGHLARYLPKIKRGDKYRGEEIAAAAVKRGVLTEHLLCGYLGPWGERDRRHLYRLMDVGALPRFTDVAADGTWLWDLGAVAPHVRQICQPGGLEQFMGPPRIADYHDLARWQASKVPGYAEAMAHEAALVAARKARTEANAVKTKARQDKAEAIALRQVRASQELAEYAHNHPANAAKRAAVAA